MKIPKLSTSTWISLACAAAAVVVAIFLLTADKPWDIIAKYGPPKRVKHYVAIYEWWAGAFNLLLLLTLAATARWWHWEPEIGDRRSEIAEWLPRISSPRWFWPLVAVAMAITIWCGLQRINFSVWDDEEKSVRHFVAGEYRHNAKGALEYRAADWEDAFWNYRFPTNHQLQTILSKASHSVWSVFAHPSWPHFVEPVLRWHLLAAAAASVAVLALLLRRLGFPRAAVVAAFLLALHPWHIRYAVELRGYMYTMLLGPLMVLCLLNAISTGRWRWWLGFAFSEFALLYAYPGTLFMLVAANACGLIALWLRHTPAERLAYVPRLLVSSTLAGMVWLQLMAPNIPQLAEYLATARSQGDLNARWHMNAASHFVSGIPWNNFDDGSIGYPELRFFTADSPVVAAIIFGIAGLLLLIGICRFAAARPAGWLVVALLLFPALLVYAGARKNGNYLYEWYLIFALPGLCASVALALDTLVAPLRRLPRGPIAAAALLAIAVCGYAIFSQPARLWLVTHPLQPMKDVVLLIRPSLDPDDPRQKGIITAALNVHLESYDGNVLEVQDLPNLKDIARQADAEKKPFFLVTGNDLAFAVDNPEVSRFLAEDRYFEKINKILGFDLTLTQTIWRYRPGSLAGVP